MVDPTASSRVFHGRVVVADLLAVQFLLKLNSEEGAFLIPVSGGAFFSQSEPCPMGKVFSMSGWIETVIDKKSGSGLNSFWVFPGTLYTLGYVRVPYFLWGISRYLIYSQVLPVTFVFFGHLLNPSLKVA